MKVKSTPYNCKRHFPKGENEVIILIFRQCPEDPDHVKSWLVYHSNAIKSRTFERIGKQLPWGGFCDKLKHGRRGYMKVVEKHPMIMIIVGVLGISLSSIFVKFSQAPAAVTAAWRLLWTVLFLTPVVAGKQPVRRELLQTPGKLVGLSILSGLFLAIHFVLWFESLQHTSVASSTTIV